VRCSIAVQDGMAERNHEIPADRKIEYRIGINLGDVMADGDDLLGDGVNIAARLEALADAGGVCISQTVLEHVRDRIDVSFDDLGEIEVKNITRPVRVWHWGADGAQSSSAPPTAVGGTNRSLKALLDTIRPQSLAVLPFNNMSRNEDLDFFCDGLTESLITDLSRNTEISVAARNSSFRFKGQTLNVAEAASELGVEYLIEGSAQAMGARMRINVQLIDGKSGDHLWANRYDHATDDLFKAQDDLCAQIGVEVDSRIAAGGSSRLRHSTDNAKAGEALANGFASLARYTRESLSACQRNADIALVLDPDYFAALYMAAIARTHRVLNGWAEDDAQSLAEAPAHGARGLSLDSKFTLGIISNGFADLASGDYESALAHCERGLTLDSSVAAAHNIYARCLIAVGRYDEAYREARKAVSMRSSGFPIFLISLGLACLLGGRGGDAVLALEKFREFAVHTPYMQVFLAAALVADGRSGDAKAIVREVQATDPSLRIAEVIYPYRLRDAEPRERLAALLAEAGLPA
jgi:adenylate cyclase